MFHFKTACIIRVLPLEGGEACTFVRQNYVRGLSTMRAASCDELLLIFP